MYKRWTRKIGIRYILGIVGLFSLGFIMLLVLLFVLRHKGFDMAQISGAKIMLFSALLSLIPVGSFSGFVVLFNSVNELNKKQISVIALLCVPLTIFAILFGIVMIIPSIFKTFNEKTLDNYIL